MKGVLGVLTYLLKYGPAKVRSLAEKLECSESSVQRYVRELNNIGYVIKYENHYAVLKNACLESKIFDIHDIDILKALITKNTELTSKAATELLLKLDRLESLLIYIKT